VGWEVLAAYDWKRQKLKVADTATASVVVTYLDANELKLQRLGQREDFTIDSHVWRLVGNDLECAEAVRRQQHHRHTKRERERTSSTIER